MKTNEKSNRTSPHWKNCINFRPFAENQHLKKRQKTKKRCPENHLLDHCPINLPILCSSWRCRFIHIQQRKAYSIRTCSDSPAASLFQRGRFEKLFIKKGKKVTQKISQKALLIYPYTNLDFFWQPWYNIRNKKDTNCHRVEKC